MNAQHERMGDRDVPHKNDSLIKEFQALNEVRRREPETGGRCRYRQPSEGVLVLRQGP